MRTPKARNTILGPTNMQNKRANSLKILTLRSSLSSKTLSARTAKLMTPKAIIEWTEDFTCNLVLDLVHFGSSLAVLADNVFEDSELLKVNIFNEFARLFCMFVGPRIVFLAFGSSSPFSGVDPEILKERTCASAQVVANISVN